MLPPTFFAPGSSRTRRDTGALIWALLAGGSSAHAALDVGDKAPPLTIDASLAGNVFKFSLANTLSALKTWIAKKP